MRIQALEVPKLNDPACYPAEEPEIFFAFEPHRIEQARAICRRCPALRECLQWALTHRPHGVWAGTTEAQRDDLIARHQKEPA